MGEVTASSDFDDDERTPLVSVPEATPSDVKRPCLLVIAGGSVGEVFPLDRELLIGRDPAAGLRIPDDAGVSRRHAVVRRSGEEAVLVDLGSVNGTFVDGQRVWEHRLVEGQKIRIGQTTVLRFARWDGAELETQRRLLEDALRDGLTRTFNRRYLMQRLDGEVRFADRQQQPLALLLVDLDHFKALNDRLGHLVGDEVLCHVADLLMDTLRTEDVLARYGGEEFVVLARNTTIDAAHRMAERLRLIIAARPLSWEGSGVPVTVSIGVAIFPFDESRELEEAPAQLLARADEALYRAKRAGRNSVSR